MIQIHDITNTIFTSKTYILYKEGEGKAWMVDIGDVEPVLEFLHEKQLTVEGVFLTHAHFDHIYGLEALVEHYPTCKVYVVEDAKWALASDKLNMSRYHGDRINYDRENVIVVKGGESMILFEGEPQIEFYETPGHNPGCLTMVMGNTIFTGDAYIPGVGVNTRLPRGDKGLAEQSMARIILMAKGKNILSGHQMNYDNSNTKDI